ncbi:MAG: FGGY-family carbohydrate kinase [Conexivisphaerales archaeon]
MRKLEDIDSVIANGGGSMNAKLNQLKADMLGKEVLVPKVKDATVLG